MKPPRSAGSDGQAAEGDGDLREYFEDMSHRRGGGEGEGGDDACFRAGRGEDFDEGA